LAPQVHAALAAVGLSRDAARFVGEVVDIDSFYAGVDILLVPSRSESFPNVVVEAISSGVLIAATAVGDIPEIVGGKLRLAGASESVSEVAISLARLSDIERARIAGDIKTTIVERYGVDSVAKSHVRFWSNDFDRAEI
jgi:glycosyltransferase involved in cell wall biosynthesis